MNKASKKGRIGSQQLLQVAVDQHSDLLNKAFQKAGAINKSKGVSPIY